ncbi:MAG TPA: phosphatidylserine/phosphatidylglycerophosphate/cardiolipin synthase family protein [Alphaproteobacteria bacterium]|nr:phosphatidylserine/phosphatidylglycerophosphate/cardiolipin synthase family protein [Alphaproteobacteria bacterium]
MAILSPICAQFWFLINDNVKAWIGFALAALLLAAGCATPGPRSSYLEGIEPDSITNLTAYCAGNSLEIRYPLRGGRAFAHTTWDATQGNTVEYQCQFSVLTFEREKRAARKSIVSPKNRISVQNAAQWKELLQAVFAGLAPRTPGHGVLLLAQDMELVLFRNATGELKAVRLEHKPPGIIVDHTFSDADFSREAIKIMTASVGAIQNQRACLFLTGDEPVFVLVDVPEHVVVFLTYPTDPDAQPIAVPGSFALRVINSLLIKSLVITAVKNPVSLIGRGLWHIDSSGVTVLNSLALNAGDPPPPPPLYTGPGMDLPVWEKKLDHIVNARRHKGRVQLFIDGNQFFPELVQSIETAKHSVDVMIFIFGTDNFAVKIADVLKQKSATVHTRVLMDDIGSLFASGAPASAVPPYFQPPGDIKSYLQDGAHVHVRLSTDPWLAVDHRKCFIIDHSRAYIGGMNIGWLYRYQWHDLMVGLTGPVVGQLEKDYEKAWALAGPFGDFDYARVVLFDREHVRQNAPPGSIDIRVLRTATGEMQIYHAQLEAIRRAKRYIYIENAYFNDDTILHALIDARQRGVDVRVIIPGESDVGIMQASDLVMANEMVRNGIRVFIYPGMAHVKAAIYDGWACVGSANMEKMSLRVSQELDVAFSDPDAVAQLNRQLFEADFKRSHELKDPVDLNWADPFLKAISEQL